MRHLEGLLRPFFDKYDGDQNGKLDKNEFWSVFHDLQENVHTHVSYSTRWLRAWYKVVPGPARGIVLPRWCFSITFRIAR